MENDSRRGGRERAALLTARDLTLLDFAARHRLFLGSHAQALLGLSAGTAGRRLRALARGGYVVSTRVFVGHPACYQISRDGLAAVGSDLPLPRQDLRAYAHDVGVAWLWLAGLRGSFGPLKEMVAERTLRSEDARAAAAARAPGAVEDPLRRPWGVRLGGSGPLGRERLHYPDLLLVTPNGNRVALELELSSKGKARRERILAGYGSDARIGAVLYLVEDARVGRAVEASARRLGMASLVQVQRVGQTLAPPGVSSARRRTAPGRRDASRGAER
jgi:hypothetical protein